MIVNQNVVSVMFIVTLTYFDAPCLGYHLLSNPNTSLTRKTRQTNCRPTEFACISDGECLVLNKKCDGHRDCTDSSDESYECKDVPCPEDAFRCSYGACVDGNYKCNGQQECADGSDEDPAICGGDAKPKLTTLQPPLSDGFCPAIEIDNGQYEIIGQSHVSGSPIPNYSLVQFTCNTNYTLSPNNPILNCVDGNWRLPVPQCKSITCPPRISISVDVTCTVDGKPVDCSQPLEDGAMAVSKCKHFYKKEDNVNPISRCSGGLWDKKLIRCEPECGKVADVGVTFVISGQNVTRGEFPWHIALYRFQEEKYKYQCGGSIITPRIIITAAHCFTQYPERNPAKEYYVGAGKYYSDYYADSDKDAQKNQIKEYYIPPNYRGSRSNYAGDIALGVLKKPFQMTYVVQPVCVDWNNMFESEQLKSNNIGTVVGWGYTDPNKGQASEELKQLNAPYIDVGQCLDAVPEDFQRWVTSDKFCAGLTSGASVCHGDSGGGIVFDWTENNKQKYYIRGLVSVGPVQNGICDKFQYGVYTRISHYKDFIINIIAANPIVD